MSIVFVEEEDEEVEENEVQEEERSSRVSLEPASADRTNWCPSPPMMLCERDNSASSANPEHK